MTTNSNYNFKILGTASDMQAPEGWSGESGHDQYLMPQLLQAKARGLVLQGKPIGVEQVNLGGQKQENCLIIMLGTVKAYLPESFAGARANLRNYIGLQIEFCIKKIDAENNLVLVSRADAIQKKASFTWESLEAGQNRPAKVKVVGEHNILVDIGGVLARIPRSELSWGFIEPEKAFKTGQELVVHILRADKEKQRVIASLKALEKNPWDHISEMYRINGEYKGTVTGFLQNKETNGGIFVNLDSGVSTLCPWPLIATPKIGDRVIIRIKSINPEKKRITGHIIREARD